MSSPTYFTLEEMTIWANTYFGDVFSKLPSASSLYFAKQEPGQAEASSYADEKLLIGYARQVGHAAAPIWAYCGKEQSVILFKLQGQKMGHSYFDVDMIPGLALGVPFQYTLPLDAQEGIDDPRLGQLQCLIRYFFLQQGLIPTFCDGGTDLALFESACRSVVAKRCVTQYGSIKKLLDKNVKAHQELRSSWEEHAKEEIRLESFANQAQIKSEDGQSSAMQDSIASPSTFPTHERHMPPTPVPSFSFKLPRKRAAEDMKEEPTPDNDGLQHLALQALNLIDVAPGRSQRREIPTHLVHLPIFMQS